MPQKFDLIAIGRAAVDLNAVEYNRPLEDTKTFAKFVGGSPANIAIGSAKLGQKVGFIGKVSDDQLGHYVTQYMASVDIDTSNMVKDDTGHKIGLTFTEIISPEESDILMYRNEAADLYLNAHEVSRAYLAQTKMLVISGTGLAQSPSREAILKALLIAKELGVEVIFELDYRPYTWQNAEETSLYYQLVAQKADVIIGTRDEFDVLENHQGRTDQETIATLFQYDANLIVIKSGIQGSNAYTKAGETYHFGVFKTKVLKSFGAGDSFAAGFLYAYQHQLGLETALKYGSAAASIVISQLSSSEAMPNLDQLTAFIEKAEAQEVHQS